MIISLAIWSLFVLVVAGSLALVGIAWAPVGGVMGALIARRRDIKARRVALVSAAYSVLSPFLWLNFTLMALEKNGTARKVLKTGYAFTFFSWFILIVDMSLFEFVIDPARPASKPENTPHVAVGLMLLAGAYAWIISMVRYSKRPNGLGTAPYLPPFVFFAVFMFTFIVNFLLIPDYLSTEAEAWVNWSLIIPTAGTLLWIFWPSGPWLPQRVRTFFEGDVS